MVLKLIEGFGDGAWDYRVTGMTAAGVDSAYGKDGYGARLGDLTNYSFSFAIANPAVVGFHFKIVDYTQPTRNMVSFDSGNGDSCGLFYDSGNARVYVQYKKYDGATYTAYSDNGSVPTDSWHHIEMNIYQAGAPLATLDWALDGGPLVGLSAAAVTSIYGSAKFGYGNSVRDWYVDNLYYCDTTGTVNNDLLGPIRVDDLLPDGVGNYSNMTPYGGPTNYELVDENPPNDDTDYVYSETEGDKDTYAMNDTTDSSEAIAGVVASIVSRKTDAGAKFLRPVVRIGGVDYTGDSGALAETYGLVSHVWDESPATATTWASTEIDGMEVGQEVRDS